MSKILLVEDDKSIVYALTDFLYSEGFSVLYADGQKCALELLKSEPFDLILLDVCLLDGNGFSLCAEIKKQYTIPVIFLTASSDEGSIVTGLDIGADDYISKPFKPRELISRIRSVLRRCAGIRNIITAENISIDTDKGTVEKNGEEIILSALEYKILLLFAANRGCLLSRTRLLDEIWDIAVDFVNDNTLTVYIKRIREKIEDDPQNPKIIKTIRGMGYRMD